VVHTHIIDERLELFPELDDACQCSTIYWEGKPIATLQRRRVIDRQGPAWTLYSTDGGLLHRFWLAINYQKLAQRTFNVLRMKGVVQ
jgi:hypothetical protein